jgi:DNA replication protein DnaC
MTTYPKPERPENKICKCGASISPEFIEPIEVLGRLLSFTNQWKFESDHCPLCVEEIEQDQLAENIRIAMEREEKEKKEKLDKLNQSLEKMIGPRGMAEFDLNKFHPSLESNQAFQICSTFDPEKENLFIWGPAGVGKTHLAAGVLKNFHMSGIPSIFIKHAALNRSMQGLKSTEYELKLAEYTGAGVVVVDDLGTAKRTEFSDQVLYEVLDGRYMSYKNGMIITSNLSLKDLSEVLGDDRLVSRIAGMCKIINLKGQDYRVKK